MLPELGEALMELGEFAEAAVVLDGAAEAADAILDERLRANAALIRLMVGFYAGEEGWVAQVEEEARRAIPIFDRYEDHGGLARAWRLLFGVHEGACRYAEAAEAAERVIAEARAAGDRRLEARGTVGFVIAATYGPMPAEQAIAQCESLMAAVQGDRRTEGLILTMLSQLVAMSGDVERARELYRRGRRNLEDLGVRLLAASNSIDSWRVEMLAGDLDAAERELRQDYAALEAMGERYALSTIAGLLGKVVYLRGDADEALRLSVAGEQLSSGDDIQSQALWRSVRAMALARQAEVEAADALSAEAVAILAATQAPFHHADALVDRAEVLTIAGRPGEADAVLRQAANLYLAKGDLISADRVRQRITSGRVA
jgi:tetratricopeptide (TPR) repeat protein